MLDLYNSHVNVKIVQPGGVIQIRLDQHWYSRLYRYPDYTWQKQPSNHPLYGYHGEATELSDASLAELTLARLEGKIKNV